MRSGRRWRLSTTRRSGLRSGQERLVNVTRLASWQTLARKMAHEVKNSLTPIRLTMEEILARRGERDERFLEQASQIVVDEVVTLEKRVRAFSQFASEPPVQLAAVDVNALARRANSLSKERASGYHVQHTIRTQRCGNRG